MFLFKVGQMSKGAGTQNHLENQRKKCALFVMSWLVPFTDHALAPHFVKL